MKGRQTSPPSLDVYRLRRRTACFVASILLVLGAASGASAQPSSDSHGSEQRRTTLYREGVEAASANRWSEAKDRFDAVLAIRASPKVYFSLGQVEQQLGHLASAQADYDRALEEARTAGESDVVTAAEQARAALAPRVPRMRVLVSFAGGARPMGDANAATAALDGKPVAIDAAVAVDPGPHHLVVTAPGARTASVDVELGERQQIDVPVSLEPSVPAPPSPASPPAAQPGAARGHAPASPPAEPVRHSTPWPAVSLVMAGAGVATLAVGTYLGFEAKSKNDESNREGCDGNACTVSAAQLRRDALSAASASTVAFAAGGALVVGGALLWLLAPSGDRDRQVALRPVALGSGGAGILVSGPW